MRPSGRARAALRIVSVLAVGGAMLSALEPARPGQQRWCSGTSLHGRRATTRPWRLWSRTPRQTLWPSTARWPQTSTSRRQRMSSVQSLRAGRLAPRNVTSDLTLGSLGTLKVRSRLRLSDRRARGKCSGRRVRSSLRSGPGTRSRRACHGRPGLPSWAWAPLP